MVYNEDDYFLISGIQHFRFCRRQWALIHIENQWAENVRTVEGEGLHRRAHNASARERRGDLLVTRDMRVFSPRLGITGACDVVEFRRDSKGVPIRGEEGLYLPFPVEYKRGSARKDDADELQLCAQAMCLEEMLVCDIPSGALFHGETRRRQNVVFTPELRAQAESCLDQMRELWHRSRPPRGGWIEISLMPSMISSAVSRPPRGGWIEICNSAVMSAASRVPPPHGAGGLKLTAYHDALDKWMSRPPRGGWIEISLQGFQLRRRHVPPPTGRVD